MRSAPLSAVRHANKKAWTRIQAFSLNLAVREGLIRCAHPAGRRWRSKTQAFCRTLSRLLAPLGGASCKKKSLDANPGFLFEFGGERGVRTLDTLSRIHTFQACSFSHSDTSPYFVVAYSLVQRGATIGREGDPVKQNFLVSTRPVNLCSLCRKLRRTARTGSFARAFPAPQATKKPELAFRLSH